MIKIIRMTVNGIDKELAIDERESLLDTLRHHFGLTDVRLANAAPVQCSLMGKQ